MIDYLVGIFKGVGIKIALSRADLITILFSLLVSIVMGFIISQVYKYTQRGMNHEISFMTSLVLLAPLVTLVMLFIQGDLIISLGLIGSLSIIRFRSAIKDTRDMVYLFWSIIVGLGSGTSNWTIVIIGSIILLLVLFILYFSKYGKSKNLDFILIISSDQTTSYELLENTISKFSKQINIRSQEIQNDMWELVVELDLKSPSATTNETLIRELYSHKFVKSVSLLAPQLSLPA